MNQKRGGSGGIALLVVLLLALGAGVWLFRTRPPDPAHTPSARAHGTTAGGGSGSSSPTSPTARPTGPGSTATPTGPTTLASPDGGSNANGRVIVRAAWGSGPGQLGHDRPAEGNAEGPMSMTVDPSGQIIVLDQVNNRLHRFGADGRPGETVPLPVRAAQDVAVSRDGSMAVLDRLGDRAVAIMGPDGRVRGNLPLHGPNVPEGGGVTAVVIDGNDVFVEREHGPLVRIGDTNARPDSEREEIPGRPTRDGLSYISAGIIDGPTGRFMVNSVERASMQHRFTREFHAALAITTILLLDTDRAGTIYVAIAGHAQGSTEEAPALSARLYCLDPLLGRPLGQAALPINTTPDESFREMVVQDDGGVLYAVRSEEGVSIQRFDCR